jgi:hypothetical protein
MRISMAKRKKEEAAEPSCPSTEGKPDADAQYEAFKKKNEEAKLLLKTFKSIKNIIVVQAGRAVWARAPLRRTLPRPLHQKARR